MRKVLLVAMGALSVVGAMTLAFAENRLVDANSLYVRTNPRGFFVGTLYGNAFGNSGFYRQQTSGDYSYGYAGGNFQGCGWIETRFTKPGGSTPRGCQATGFSGTGQASREFLQANYASRINDYIPGQNLPRLDGGSAVRIKPGVIAGTYGNYRGGLHQNAYANIDSSFPLAWRWISKDGRSVAVNIFPGEDRAVWAFVLRDKLPDTLPYSDGNRR